MGFQQEVRKAESRSTAMAQRVQALCRCAEKYSPIGFHATLDYLEAHAGPFRTDGEALFAAVEMLREAHSLWQQELRQYAARRRGEKDAGQRVPRPLDPNPNILQTWHGREREAALFSVKRWRERTGGQAASDELEDQLRALADRALESGLTDADKVVLESVVRQADAHSNWETYQADPSTYFRGRTLGRVAHHLQVANAT